MALAIVDSESTENWSCFLKIIKENVFHEKEISYLSDRNVGLMAAFNEVFEKPLHFFCLYHLYTNLKVFKGSWSNEFRKKMVGLFKRCAHAPTKSLFHQCLDEFIEAGVHWLQSF